MDAAYKALRRLRKEENETIFNVAFLFLVEGTVLNAAAESERFFCGISQGSGERSGTETEKKRWHETFPDEEFRS